MTGKYKAPKGITKHIAVKTCDYGPDSGVDDYRHDVWLKDGWKFSAGRMANCQGGHFNSVEDFNRAHPALQFSELFKNAFHSTYQAIGDDVEQAFEGTEYAKVGYEERNYIMAESVLDANRMQMYGGPEGKQAKDEMRKLIDANNWSVVCEQAAKQLL
jgi:hypothetical protein